MARGHKLTRIGNRASILRMIWDQPGISRVEVANNLRLSEATVSRIMRELIDDKYVFEAETIVDGSRGKNATSLVPNAQARHAISVHLDGSSVEVGIVAMDGTINETRVVSEERLSVPQLTECIRAEVRAARKAHSIIGLGVSLTGVVDSRTGVVKRSTRYAWENVALGKVLREGLAVPCFVTSDTKAALLGEQWVGAGQHSENLLYLLIGDHLGMAMAANGQLIEGQYTMAGEISSALDGHGLDLPDRLLKVINEEAAGQARSEQHQDISGLVKQILAGDLLALRFVDGLVDALLPFIVNTMLISDPEWVILGGTLGANEDFFLRPLQQKVAQLGKRGRPSLESRLVVSKLREKASLIGAARLVVGALLRGEIES